MFLTVTVQLLSSSITFSNTFLYVIVETKSATARDDTDEEGGDEEWVD
jgi:hypothetical protein